MDIIRTRHEDENDHKQPQLRELAKLKGTFRDQDRELLNSRGKTRDPSPDIVCFRCGDVSHPTTDCQKRGADSADLDADFRMFMVKIDRKLGEAKDSMPIASEADGGVPTDTSTTAAAGNENAETIEPAP